MLGITKLSAFTASIATQLRAAIQVGIPADDAVKARRSAESEPTLDLTVAHVWDDALGRTTRNGLDSLEIGAGKTRIDE